MIPPRSREDSGARYGDNYADDLVNPPELGLMEDMIKRVPRGRFVLLPITESTRGHGTHSLPAIWKPYLAEFLTALFR